MVSSPAKDQRSTTVPRNHSCNSVKKLTHLLTSRSVSDLSRPGQVPHRFCPGNAPERLGALISSKVPTDGAMSVITVAWSHNVHRAILVLSDGARRTAEPHESIADRIVYWWHSAVGSSST